MKILQIVPRLPPASRGVGDYAVRLAPVLREIHDITSAFLAAAPNAPTPARDLPGPAFRLTNPVQVSTELRDAGCEPDALVLHYAGYGYAPRGCPAWLPRVMSALSEACDDAPVLVMFHELFARGSVLTSSFWNYPRQRRVVRQLATLARTVRTNRSHAAREIAALASRSEDQIVALPVFSNLGECQGPPAAFATRENQLVTFGVRPAQRAEFDDYWSAAGKAAHAVGAERIVLIGTAEAPGAPVDGIPVEPRGYLDQAEVHAELSRSRYAFLDYYDGYLAKSGTFAAYAAHGLAPIVWHRNDSSADGLVPGEHYLEFEALNEGRSLDAELAAAHLFDWYQPHSLAETARSYAGQLHELLSS